jgi:hypothetical protein
MLGFLTLKPSAGKLGAARGFVGKSQSEEDYWLRLASNAC